MKATEQYFHVVLTVYCTLQGGFEFEFVVEILKLLSRNFLWCGAISFQPVYKRNLKPFPK